VCEVKLEPGAKLVLYTDGVIEARCPDGGMLGVDGLAELLASCGDLDTVATGERIHRAVIEACGDPRDDIAILVVRAAQAGRPGGNEGLVRSGAIGQRRALNRRLRGGPRAPSAARAALDGLGERSLDPGAAHQARLLVSELITNSVRHAGATAADSIGVDAELTPDALRVQVADHGPGFTPAPVLPAPEQTFGRGLFLVDHLADRWGTDDHGRRIWFELDRRPDAAHDDGPSAGPPLESSEWRRRAFA
jgi:anti-sigma regulatory factor (Ser/Thr protein kinase)